MKRCATTEASPAAEPAAELVLSGHEDCREGQKAIHGGTRMRGLEQKTAFSIADIGSQGGKRHTKSLLGAWFICKIFLFFFFFLKFQTQHIKKGIFCI